MSDVEAPPEEATSPEPSIEPTPVPQDPKQRVRACAKEIGAILNKYHCDIVPYVGDPKFVGEDRQQVLLEAFYLITVRR